MELRPCLDEPPPPWEVVDAEADGDRLVLSGEQAARLNGNLLRLTSWAREAWGRCGAKE